MLSVRLLVTNRLLVVKFEGVRSYMWMSDCRGKGVAPLTMVLFKGPLSLKSQVGVIIRQKKFNNHFLEPQHFKIREMKKNQQGQGEQLER